MATGLAEAASIGGLVGLSFTLLHGCVEGFKLILEAKNLGKDASYLICALCLEENRLVLWARRSGLSRGHLDERLNETLIHQTLGNIHNLLCDTSRLKRDYGLDLRDNTNPAN